MATIDTETGRIPCPDTIAVIGGGRWARVMVEVLAGLLPESVALAVHSPGNARSMAAWAHARGLGGRIHCTTAWPRSPSVGTGAAIVVNAARDHERAAEFALSAGLPTLVEKPMALTASAAQRLVDLSRSRNIRFAAAHVFVFAPYLENFSRLLADAGHVESMRIEWTDPQGEERYGERKRFDAGLPVFDDWLPHVVSIAGVLLGALPDQCRALQVRRGGAALELELMTGGIPCAVLLERNALQRGRVVTAIAGGERLELDFSTEPGTIARGSSIGSAAADWDSRSGGPLARMLSAFVAWAAGGKPDARLDVAPGIRACALADQVRAMYRAALMPWLRARLAGPTAVDEDLRYALAELLQSQGAVSAEELERQLETVKARCAGPDGARWLDEVTRATTDNPRESS